MIPVWIRPGVVALVSGILPGDELLRVAVRDTPEALAATGRVWVRGVAPSGCVVWGLIDVSRIHPTTGQPFAS